jgi:hypothetical protein
VRILLSENPVEDRGKNSRPEDAQDETHAPKRQGSSAVRQNCVGQRRQDPIAIVAVKEPPDAGDNSGSQDPTSAS